MRTEKQIEASRINGAKSRGPVTSVGKRRSSRNALRHGRLACSLTLSLEDESQFREILRDLCDDHQPANYTEHSLVESMAISKWKQFRIIGAADVVIDMRMNVERRNPPEYEHMGAAVISKSIAHILDEHRSLTAMNVERSRLERDYLHALAMLYKTQDRRLRNNGPAAESGSDPDAVIEQESLTPELVEESDGESDCTEAPAGRLGILPDNEINCAKIPANSLKTNETSRVCFSEPTVAQALVPAVPGFSPASSDSTQSPSTALQSQHAGSPGDLAAGGI
jgi:hypothetical protein